jgi:hypothetical protein
MPLANLAIVEYKLNEARDALAEGLQLAHELGDWPGLAEGLTVAGRLAVALQQPLVGVQLHAAADALRHERGLRVRASLEHDIEATRVTFEPSAVEAACLAGASMSVEEAVEVALSL